MPYGSWKLRWRTNRPPDDPDQVRMTLGEHLEELRSRMIKLLIGLLVGALVCFIFRERMMQLLLGPTFGVLAHNGLGTELVALDPLEPFMTTLRTAFIIGFVVSAPYGLYQIWAFVAAGLYAHERRFVKQFLPISVVLFYTGALFFLLIVMPVLLHFLIQFMTTVPQFDPGGLFFGEALRPEKAAMAPTTHAIAPDLVSSIPVLEEPPANPPDGYAWLDARSHELRIAINNQSYVIELKPAGQRNRIRPNFSMRYTIDFTLRMAASFGLGFQVPVVVAFLAATGICTAEQMGRSRRVTWFVMSIASAVFTPPDVSSLLLLFFPMVFLFEAGLYAARVIERRRARENP